MRKGTQLGGEEEKSGCDGKASTRHTKPAGRFSQFAKKTHKVQGVTFISGGKRKLLRKSSRQARIKETGLATTGTDSHRHPFGRGATIERKPGQRRLKPVGEWE